MSAVIVNQSKSVKCWRGSYATSIGMIELCKTNYALCRMFDSDVRLYRCLHSHFQHTMHGSVFSFHTSRITFSKMIEEKLIHRALTTIKSSVITSRMAAAVCLCVVAVCGTEYRTQRKEEREKREERSRTQRKANGILRNKTCYMCSRWSYSQART